MINDLLMKKVVLVAQEAGAAVMNIYHAPQGHISFKSDKSPITEADLISNSILKEELVRILKIPYLSEESEDILFSERNLWKTFWMVDPLDGTKEFLSSKDEFTINIALIHNNELILGVIYVPARNIIYYGLRNFGSYRQISENAPEKLPIKKNKEDSLKVVTSRFHSDDKTFQFIVEKFKKNFSVVSMGSSLKFCLLAEGEVDFYPRLSPTREWDTAAGHAILKFCGGAVLDLKSNRELCYNKKNLENNYFIGISSARRKNDTTIFKYIE